jgi:hypothetical protein
VLIPSPAITKFPTISFWFFNLVFIFFLVRFFGFHHYLGFGLGDAYYLVLYSGLFICNNLFYFLLRSKGKIVLRRIRLIIFTLMFIAAVYLILLMYVFYGAEVEADWGQGIYKW